jgi:hypothetical protein
MKLRTLVAASAAAAAALPASAMAAPQVVVGTTSNTLSLSVPTPAAFTNLTPDGTEKSSSTASVAALSTNPTWTLTAKDYGTNGSDGNGQMDALTAGRITALNAISGIDLTGLSGVLDATHAAACANSESELANPVKVQVAPSVVSSAIDSAGKVALNGSGVTVANNHAGNLLPLPLTTFNTQFFQTVGTGEAVNAGCVYNVAVAYTLG